MLHRALVTAAALAGATLAQADGHGTAVPFALDWKFEGPSAPYFLAIDNGYFAEEGLNVTIEAGSGSTGTIPKIATGAFPIGFGDINAIIKFLDQNPGAPVTAVMMVYNKPPFAIVGRKSLGVETPADLEGKVLGAPPPDGAWAQFPVFAAETGIDPEKITVEPVGFPTREPMLAEGNVAAITGFSFSSVVNLQRLGVPAEDISSILMADHGLVLYGNAIMVNTDFAAENPEVVEGFLRAVAKGWSAAIADPAAGADAVLARNPAADKTVETNRLQMSIDDNVNTDWVQANGFGVIDPARLEASLTQLAATYEFQGTPDASLYFTDVYLPEGGFSLK